MLAGRLDALGDARLQVGVAARAGQRVGALHGLEQFARVRVVLDRHDRGLDDGQAALGAPLVRLFDRSGQAHGKAERILLQLGDAVALARVVGVQAEGRRQRTDHLVEQLVGGGVVEIGEVEHLARLQIARRHEVLHEQDRIDDLQRIRAARHRADLGAEETVVPIDLGLRAEAIVGKLLQRDEERGLLRTRLAAELEALPTLPDERRDQAVAGEDRLRIRILRAPFIAARLGDEAGDRTVLDQQQPIAFGHHDLRAVADDVRRRAGIGAAPGIGAVRHRCEERRCRRQAGRHGVEILPLIGENATDRTRHRLYQTHDNSV